MSAITVPNPMRFTRSDYYRMADAGMFIERRVELIDGEIIEMPSQKNSHAVCLGLCERATLKSFGPNYWIRSQLPLHFKDHSEPEPDVAVVRGSPRDFKDHPKTALLILEVADTTLTYDQMVKSSLYAREGILDYWIVNLVDEQLEVYRDPVADRTRRFGFRYSNIVTLQPGQSVSPLSLPRKKIAVADLLP